MVLQFSLGDSCDCVAIEEIYRQAFPEHGLDGHQRAFMAQRIEAGTPSNENGPD
jgi:hypothetical protein